MTGMASACSVGNEPSAGLLYETEFRLDSTQRYVDGLYNKEWIPATGEFVGTLLIKGSTATLTVLDSTYRHFNESEFAQPLHAPDTLFLVREDDICRWFLIYLWPEGGPQPTTYTQSHDCHSRSSAGSVVLVR